NGLLHQHINPLRQQATTDARVLVGGHCDADGVHAAAQRFKIAEAGTKLIGDAPSAFGIGVHDPNEVHAFDLAIDAGVVTSEIADPYHCNANNSLSHPAFAPEISFGRGGGAPGAPLGCASGATASMAMPASSAASMSRGRSKSKVRQASMASAVACERLITSTVRSPTTGTSKRIS